MSQIHSEFPQRAPTTAAPFVALSWLVIAALTGFLAVSNNWPGAGRTDSGDRIGPQAELPGRVIVAGADLAPQYSQMLLGQAGQLRNGSARERLAYAVLAGELDGPERAIIELNEIDITGAPPSSGGDELDALETSASDAAGHGGDPPNSSESNDLEQLRASLLAIMSDRQTARSQGVSFSAELSAAESDALQRELGWYGELALLPSQATDSAARQSLVHSAMRLLLVLCAYGLWFLAAVITGIIILIILLVQSYTGGIRSRVMMESARHGFYAEVFAIWIVLFLLLQVAVQAMQPPVMLRIGLSGGLMLTTLVALGWAMMRGVTWRDIRRDLGLHTGSGVALEIGCGLLVYCMSIAMLLAGLALSLLLMMLQQLLWPGAPPPSHPAVDALAAGGMWTFIQVLLLGVFIAPLVEETLFRGALYGHLRKALGKTSPVIAIALSALVTSTVFAAIHPQGWTLVPALMGLAMGFCIGREWRGSLLACMVAHGLHNGLTMLVGRIMLS